MIEHHYFVIADKYRVKDMKSCKKSNLILPYDDNVIFLLYPSVAMDRDQPQAPITHLPNAFIPCTLSYQTTRREARLLPIKADCYLLSKHYE